MILQHNRCKGISYTDTKQTWKNMEQQDQEQHQGKGRFENKNTNFSKSSSMGCHKDQSLWSSVFETKHFALDQT